MNRCHVGPGQQEFEANSMIRKQQINFSQYNIHLDQEIGEPHNYRDVISTLFAAEDGDDVTIYINSPGGQLDSALAIIEAIKISRAHVRVVLIGSCHSAASMISMYAKELIVLDSAISLVHTASFGTVGMTHNIKSQTDFTVKHVEKILNESYAGFLTPEELDDVKNGIEMWFDAEEIRARMIKRNAFLKKEQAKKEKKNKKVKVDEEVKVE